MTQLAFRDKFIFNWPGTLFNNELAIFEANRRLFEHFGLNSWDYPGWRQAGCPMAYHYLRHQGIANLPPSFRLRERLWRYYQAVCLSNDPFRNKPVLNPSTKDLLEFLRSKQRTVVVVSHQPQGMLEMELKAFSLRGLVSGVHGDLEEKAAPLSMLCRPLYPHQVAYVGAFSADMAAAHTAGVFPIALSAGFNTSTQLQVASPGLLLGSLSELYDKLRREIV